MAKDRQNRVVKTEVLGRDAFHERGRTTYADGTVIDWCENLAAREELLAAIQASGKA